MIEISNALDSSTDDYFIPHVIVDTRVQPKVTRLKPGDYFIFSGQRWKVFQTTRFALRDDPVSHFPFLSISMRRAS